MHIVSLPLIYNTSGMVCVIVKRVHFQCLVKAHNSFFISSGLQVCYSLAMQRAGRIGHICKGFIESIYGLLIHTQFQ
jgi:hypothetical protein